VLNRRVDLQMRQRCKLLVDVCMPSVPQVQRRYITTPCMLTSLAVSASKISDGWNGSSGYLLDGVRGRFFEEGIVDVPNLTTQTGMKRSRLGSRFERMSSVPKMNCAIKSSVSSGVKWGLLKASNFNRIGEGHMIRRVVTERNPWRIRM